MEPPTGCPRGRLASAYTLESPLDGLPVAGLMRRILIPPQKLPQFSQTLRSSSMTRLASIAFQSSFSSYDRSTIPSSTHLYRGSLGFSVTLVARPMAEFRLPNEETA